MNLSHSQFRVSGLADHFTQAATTYGLDPSCLELEITEDVVIPNPSTAREQLAAFRALGIKIALDDFGTGQSSLSTLGALPVDRLKIDRAFVRDLLRTESARAITASIIDIGHHLHLTVIAEGVEPRSSWICLRQKGATKLRDSSSVEGFHSRVQAVPCGVCGAIAPRGERFPVRALLRTPEQTGAATVALDFVGSESRNARYPRTVCWARGRTLRDAQSEADGAVVIGGHPRLR